MLRGFTLFHHQSGQLPSWPPDRSPVTLSTTAASPWRWQFVSWLLVCLLGGGASLLRAAPAEAPPAQPNSGTTIQNSVPLTCVSAASYAIVPLAPGSIVSGFGTQLATGVATATSLPLPTSLLSTRVLVNSIPASLFFVSPGQINFLLPETLTQGEGEVVVISIRTNGDEVISRGQIQVASTGPALFTADASGAGAPAGQTGRINGSNQFVYDPQPPYQSDPANPGRIIPAPIDVGTEARPAYLILYGTGFRNASAHSIQALMGGDEVPILFFGANPDFAGLDQVNIQLPASLKGRGLIEVTVVVDGVASNSITLDVAGTPSQTLSILGFSNENPALAGQTIIIEGSGFSSQPIENLVRFGPAQARVVAATANQLTVIVPFGAQSGQITVQTNSTEARSQSIFKVKTSISGIIQSTGSPTSAPSPLQNVTVRLAGTNITARTNPQGTFVLSDVPPGISLVEIDGATTAVAPPYPAITLKVAAREDRDNQFAQPISLQQINGGSAILGTSMAGANGSTAQLRSALSSLPYQRVKALPSSTGQLLPVARTLTISDREVALEVPFGAAVKFPDGKTSGQVQLTVLEGGRLPGITLPGGIYSPSIAQITPIGTRFSPGVSLSFPNPEPERLPPGTRVGLYRYDPATGTFLRRGTATVSEDGSRISSDGRLVDIATFWMIGLPGGVTTVTGRVVDPQGRPVAGAKVSVNGRAHVSDQNGGFSLSDLWTAGQSALAVEAILPQQFGTPPRGQSALTPVVIGGITHVGTITLSNTRQAGLVLSPFVLDLRAGDPSQTINLTLTQPAPPGGLLISLTSGNQSVARVPTSITLPAGQITTSFQVTRTGPGVALIEARAVLGGLNLESTVGVTVAGPAPLLTQLSETSIPVGASLTISGEGLSLSPNNQTVSFYRNQTLIAIANPFENQVLRDASGNPTLRIRVPAIPPGPVSLVVSVTDGRTGITSEPSRPLHLTITDLTLSPPILSGITPNEGRPRDVQVITGNGFSPIKEENLVRFLQEGLSAEAQILQASSTSLTVVIPALGINRGGSTVIAQRLAPNGVTSSPSNALSFRVTDSPPSPSTPFLTTIVNAANNTPAGKDGDVIRASGTGFGTNLLNRSATLLTNGDPVLTLFVFLQNNEFVNFSIPVGAVGGVELRTIIPSGLQRGIAQITVINYDLETGLISEESVPSNFTITEGSDFRLDEGEPNDTPELATEIFIPSTIEGRIAPGDPGTLIVRYSNGVNVTLSDLFRLVLDQTTRISIQLTFAPEADLDLFVLRRNQLHEYDVIASSTNTQGAIEGLVGDLPSGNYLIGIGAIRGSSAYRLTLQIGMIGLLADPTGGLGATATDRMASLPGNSIPRQPLAVSRRQSSTTEVDPQEIEEKSPPE
jgi:uncharacterized protein (TIGR03437 family)